MGSTTIGVEKVGDLMVDLAQFNRQHDQPSGLMSMLALGPTSSPTMSGEALRLNRALLHLKHRDLLQQTGLVLEPVATGNKVFGMGQEIAATEMRINVANGNSLITFLANLEEPKGDDWPLYRGVIGEQLTQILSQQLQQYDLRQPSDEALELFGVLEQYIDQVVRLIGRSDATDELRTLLTIARQGYLVEYLETRSLLYGFGHASGFGPSIWHRDNSPAHYDGPGYWGGAVEKVKAMDENPRARTYQLMLTQHLLLSALYARQDILTHQHEDWLVDNASAFLDTLAWVGFELSGV